MMKALPLAYNRDMQEDKESLFDAFDTVSACVSVFTDMIASASWNTQRMESSCEDGYLNATDVADYLVRKDIPFRTAHGIAAKAVRIAVEKKCKLEELPIEDFKACSDRIEDDIYSLIDSKSCVASRKTEGGPAAERVAEQIRALKDFAEERL